MKPLLCFGTRPEAIKMAPISKELNRLGIDFKICITAQHREMLDQVMDFFEMTADYDLDLMKPNQSLNELSSLILSKIDEVLEKEVPDIVLVQGDTTTAVIIALAAFHRGIKVGHVEAGLRTFNKLAPFPEEVNRQIISKIADVHFAPTSQSFANLLKEQISEDRICTTGNTVVDALQWAIQKMESEPFSEGIQKIKALLNPNKKLVLVTGHRRESFGGGLIHICEGLLKLSEREDVELIYPVHLNPNVTGPVQELLSHKKNIHLVPPVSYPVMLWLIKHSHFIISDSGGIQEEAPTFKKMVLVTREVSERMEGVEAGFSILVGTDKDKIIFEAERILNNPADLKVAQNPYGDGTAAKQIVRFLLDDS